MPSLGQRQPIGSWYREPRSTGFLLSRPIYESHNLYYVKSWLVKTAAEVVRNIRAMLFRPLSLQG